MLTRLKREPKPPMAAPMNCYRLTSWQVDYLETGLLFMAAHWRARMEEGDRTSVKGGENYQRWAAAYRDCLAMEHVLTNLHSVTGELDLCIPTETTGQRKS